MLAILNDDSCEPPPLREPPARRYTASVPLADADAGARIRELFRRGFAGGVQRIVLTSADHHVSRDVVEHAFDALRYSGLVCVTTREGAFALIGMTGVDDVLLEGVPWGTEHALTGLLRAARERHLPMVILPECLLTELARA